MICQISSSCWLPPFLWMFAYNLLVQHPEPLTHAYTIVQTVSRFCMALPAQESKQIDLPQGWDSNLFHPGSLQYVGNQLSQQPMSELSTTQVCDFVSFQKHVRMILLDEAMEASIMLFTWIFYMTWPYMAVGTNT